MTIGGLIWAVVSLAICGYGFHSASYTLTSETLETLNTGSTADLSGLVSLVDVPFLSDIAFKNALDQQLGSAVAGANEGAILQADEKLNLN